MVSDPQQAVAAFLSRPEAHGQPPGTPVETLRTHASIVFLCGDSALKLKQAVRYSYLDYSTPELRRAACMAELAFNRRIAPDLYLGVRAIGRAADGALAWDAGEPVDWVVAMRRFPAEALFDRMAERGALTRELMVELTETVAAFHARAEPRTDHGGPAAMARLIDDSIANLKQGMAADKVERLRAGLEAALGRVGALLDRRRAAGLVRQCHGDLHLGNICLFQGRPTLFDAIEFDPAIYTIDALYDLAFLLMDLRHRRLDDFASLVFNRYLDAMPDGDGIAALPLFMSLRAAIRAHVSLAAGRAQVAEPYFDLALALLAPVPPRLVAIGGLSGTGKSTLAAALAPEIGIAPGARVLRSDVMRKRLFKVAPTTRLPPAAYDEATSQRVFEALGAQAAADLRAGYSVIVDAVAARPEQRQAFAEVARSAGVPFTGLWLEAPQAALEQRIAARRGDASDATVELVRQQRGYDLGPIDWRRLEAGGDLDAATAAARRLLATPGPERR